MEQIFVSRVASRRRSRLVRLRLVKAAKNKPVVVARLFCVPMASSLPSHSRAKAHTRANASEKNEDADLTFFRTFGQIAVDARECQQPGPHHCSERADAPSLASLLSLTRTVPQHIQF